MIKLGQKVPWWQLAWFTIGLVFFVWTLKDFNLTWFLGGLGIWWLGKEYSMGMCYSKKKLHGKTAIVTGANVGIGYETAKDLANRGARVILACRNKDKGTKAVQQIIAETENKEVELIMLDLASFQSVKDFVKEANMKLDKVDILVNNAAMPPLDNPVLSGDNYDLILQSNFFSQFLLTVLLKNLMKRSDEPRIVNNSSMAAILLKSIDYSKIKKGVPYETTAYQLSKFMLCLFTTELARRWGSEGFLAFSHHPGLVRTEIFDKWEKPKFFRDLPSIFQSCIRLVVSLYRGFIMKSCYQGAQTQIYLCVEDGLKNGEYFTECRPGMFYTRNKEMMDPKLSKELWEFSENLVRPHLN